MSATGRQGLVFVTAAFLLIGYEVFVGLPNGGDTLPYLALLIVLLGVPHGALDTLYAGRVFGIRRPWQWLLFTLAYLLPVMAVMVLWPYWPAFFLLLFLAVSMVHFSGDPGAECPRWLRLLYGGAPVVLPALLHGSEVERLFGALVPAAIAGDFRAGLSFLAWPWLVALAAGAVALGRTDRQGALEIAAAGTVCSVVPPLASFALFFCAMHSARHILRSVAESEGEQDGAPVFRRWTFSRAAMAGIPPMMGTLAILADYWESMGHVAMEPRLLQTVFVGLAALTFPHVILVDWFHRWRSQ